MQIPILNGIYTDGKADFRTSFPRNMIPVATQTGASAGYIRPADGIVHLCSGPGMDRGGINWRGSLFRVMGDELISVDSTGAYTSVGIIPGGDRVRFAYSFDYLAIAAGGKMYLYDGAKMEAVTDGDLGEVLDIVWVDGYFMTTDGAYLVVTDLENPFSVNPFKYGSSEADPDDIVALLKIKNEVYAVNRYTIEIFDNVGGITFPFQRIEGAQIEKGAISRDSACVFLEAVAFIGGGVNEEPSVYLGSNGSVMRIATPEIDRIISEYSGQHLSEAILEPVCGNGQEVLMIHFHDKTIAYDSLASKQLNQPVWYVLTSLINGIPSGYRGRGHVRAYDRWIVADTMTSQLGYLTRDISTHYGNDNDWEFGTAFIYNGGKSAIIHTLELVAITGRVPQGKDPVIYTQYSNDGETWSERRYIHAGLRGDRVKRLRWFRQGFMRNVRAQRFGGDSDTFLSLARLDAAIEPLEV